MPAREPVRQTRIGKALRAARERTGLSLQRVAEKAKMEPSVLSRIESGKVKDVKLTTLAKLATVLRFSLDDFAAEAGLLPVVRGRRLTPTGLVAEDLAPLTDALADVSRRLDDLRKRAPKRG